MQRRRGGICRLVVLGSTGSVGTQALEVVRNHRDRYEVVALGDRAQRGAARGPT